jgi:ABC-type multidrug transport system fused ATPase/permease subunit
MNPLEQFLLDKKRQLRFFRWKWTVFYLIGLSMSVLSLLLAGFQFTFRPQFTHVSEVLYYLELVDAAFAVVVGFTGFVTVILMGDFLRNWWAQSREFSNEFIQKAVDNLHVLDRATEEYESLDTVMFRFLWTGLGVTELSLMVYVVIVWFQKEFILKTMPHELYRSPLIQEVSVIYGRRAFDSLIRLLIIGLLTLLGFLIHYYNKKRLNFFERLKNEVLSAKYDHQLVVRNEDGTRYISYFMVESVSIRAVDNEKDVHRFSWEEFNERVGDTFKLISNSVMLEHAKDRADWYREDVFNQ